MEFRRLVHVATTHLLLPALSVVAPLVSCAECPGCVPVHNESGLCVAPLPPATALAGDGQGDLQSCGRQPNTFDMLHDLAGLPPIGPPLAHSTVLPLAHGTLVLCTFVLAVLSRATSLNLRRRTRRGRRIWCARCVGARQLRLRGVHVALCRRVSKTAIRGGMTLKVRDGTHVFVYHLKTVSERREKLRQVLSVCMQRATLDAARVRVLLDGMPSHY